MILKYFWKLYWSCHLIHNLIEFKFSAVLRSGSANGWLRLRNTGSPYTFTVCVMSLQLARHFLPSFRFCFALRVITDKSQTCIISISVQIPFLYFFTLWQSNEYSADLRIHCKKKFLELPVMYLIRHLLRYRKLWRVRLDSTYFCENNFGRIKKMQSSIPNWQCYLCAVVRKKAFSPVHNVSLDRVGWWYRLTRHLRPGGQISRVWARRVHNPRLYWSHRRVAALQVGAADI